MLLPPFLSLAILLVSRDRKRGLVHAVALSLAAVLVVIPITIRNYVVFGAFVPVSTNGGLTLWQGVADAGGRELGARRHDTLVAEEEAIRYGRPDYLDWWAEPDGIWRDNDRYRRALEVIRANPGRYARLMLGRMGEMLNYASGEAPSVLREAPALAGLRGEPRPPRGRAAHARATRSASWLPAGSRRRCARSWPRCSRCCARCCCRSWSPVPWHSPGATGAAPCCSSRVSLYYLLLESPFIYEWRVVAPMHYGLLAAAAAALVLRLRARRAPASAAAGGGDRVAS